ncbi:hypothetical protein CkaCkLH20_09443 [Colletotrichum karsti]|uniref:Uncharacterized protein n=1 Tax=Colletotrichum karsti TaxID=1095194 RepID=A0A9P6HWT5_9PEZI|nr:uncharacterized protein CkaCkLH20_09443 [Colletotrichum karsti]KAF9872933.1 hypothetical protein CkaCkLH20_09443 [Colletotrichum karsti]
MNFLKTLPERAFVAVVAGQALSITAIQLAALVSYLHWVNPVAYQVPVTYVVPMAFAISALGSLFQAVVAVDSCRVKNKSQLWAQCIINACLTITLGLQHDQTKNANDRIVSGYDMYHHPFAKDAHSFWNIAHPVSITSTAVSAVCSIAMIVIATRLHVEFAWSVYEQISPDMRMKRRHKQYEQTFLVFLKISPLFIILFVIVYSFVEVHYKQPEFALTLALVPAILIHSVYAGYCAMREYAKRMLLVMAGQLGIMAYLSSRIWFLFPGDGSMSAEMIFFASLGLAFTAASLVSAILCTLGFGQGLKKVLVPGRDGQQSSSSHLMGMEIREPPNVNLSASQFHSRRFDLE